MNMRSRKTKGLSLRLLALLLCCACLFGVAPSAIATDAASAAEASVVEPTTPADQMDSTPSTESSEEPTQAPVTSEEPSATPSPSTDPTQDAEPEESDATKLFNLLINCTTLDEIEEILNNLTEEQEALMEAFTEEQKAALAAKMNDLGAYETETATNRIYTIKQGASETVSITNMSDKSFGYTCTQNGTTVTGIKAELVRNNYGVTGYKISVDTSVATGTYTLTVNYTTVSDSWRLQSTGKKSDTVNITVKESETESAQVYYLKTPASNPDSNDQDQWCSTSIGNGKVKVGGATWINNKNVFNPGAYVTEMLGETTKQSDGSWLLNKTQYENVYSDIYNAYKEQLKTELSLDIDLDDIEAIYLIPYKISKDNGTSPDKHIDCKVSVKTTKVFTAVFWVDLPDGTQKQVDAKNYTSGSSVTKTTNAPTGNAGSYPDTMVVDGVTYKFDGWYSEDRTKIDENRWSYTPSDAELEDGTVNFYAKYVQAYTTVTIIKIVSGNMGDQSKKFEFTVTGNSNKGEDTTFELKHGNRREIKVGVGDKITITETAVDGYTTSYTIGNGDSENATAATFTVGTEGQNVIFTNKKDVDIDTGIILDKIPYILILALALVGLVVVTKRRRSRADD